MSACVTHSLKMDSRIERRLQDIAHALEDFQDQATPEVAAYCTRLNKLVSAVLVNAGPAERRGGRRRPERRPSRRGRAAEENGAAPVSRAKMGSASRFVVSAIGLTPFARKPAPLYFGSNFSDTPFMQ